MDSGGEAETAEAVFEEGDATTVDGRLPERAEGGFSSGWRFSDSRCGSGAGAARGSGGAEWFFGVGVVVEEVGAGLGSEAGDFLSGVGGGEAGGGGVGLEFGL